MSNTDTSTALVQQPERLPGLFLPSSISWLSTATTRRLIMAALTEVRLSTQHRDGIPAAREGEMFRAYCEQLQHYEPRYLLRALKVWPQDESGKWFPTVADLMRVMREVGPGPEPEKHQPAPERQPPTAEERARVEAGFTEALTAAKPEYVKLEDRERPPPRYLAGEQLAEARKAARNRLAEYGGQGAG